MVVASRCFAFRALIKEAPTLKSFRVQNSTSLLYLPIPSSAETWKTVTKKVCQFFFRLSWHLKPGKSVFWRLWENSRRLCKPSTSSRVCITVSNSPNPSRVYIRLGKHGKRFLLLKVIPFCTAHLLLRITRWPPLKRACEVTLWKWSWLKRNAIGIFACGCFLPRWDSV